jgi:PAS domain S-box-containing protein
VNRHWREYTGLSAEDSAGSRWEGAVHPEDLGRHAGKWLASLSTGASFESEVRYRRAADGQYHWYLARAVPLRDEHGKILKWYGISTEIDDRRRAESLLAGERSILEMVAKGDPLPRILDGLCRLVEEQARDVLASVLLIEEGRLGMAARQACPERTSRPSTESRSDPR